MFQLSDFYCRVQGLESRFLSIISLSQQFLEFSTTGAGQTRFQTQPSETKLSILRNIFHVLQMEKIH